MRTEAYTILAITSLVFGMACAAVAGYHRALLPFGLVALVLVVAGGAAATVVIRRVGAILRVPDDFEGLDDDDQRGPGAE